MRYFLSILLAIAALTCLAQKPMQGKLGKNVEWRIEGDVLTISGKGKMPSFNSQSSVGLKWHDVPTSQQIKKIVIEEGITEIGSFTFSNRHAVVKAGKVGKGGSYLAQTCEHAMLCNLREVQLPSSLRKIGNNAFEHIPVGNLVLPDSLAEIGSKAFASAALRCIVLPRYLKKLGAEAFSECYMLKIVDFNDAQVALPKNLFFNSNKLSVLLHPAGIKKMEDNAFNDTPFKKVDPEYLLAMFSTDGLQNFLDGNLQPRENFTGTDEEYEQLKAAAIDAFFDNEAKYAREMFEFDDVRPMPYDIKNKRMKIKTIKYGTFAVDVTAAEAKDMVAKWPTIRPTLTPHFTRNGERLEVSAIEFSFMHKKYVAQKI